MSVSRCTALFLSLLTGATCEFVYAQSLDFNETKFYVVETCPMPWESLANQISVSPGDDIWQADLSDRSRYIRFSSPGVVQNDTDGGMELVVTQYVESDAINACGQLRGYFIQAAQLDAALAMAFDHTLIRDPDADGVFSPEDVCEGTPQGVAVDADGCSADQLASDEDGDGVHDYIDQCPGTNPVDTPDANGCAPVQLDADGDGIPNDQDAYPLQHNTMCPAN